jgi:hypothetical protein
VHPVPASKTALKAILAARGAWAAVDIRDDPPSEKEDVMSRAATPGRWDGFWFEPTEIPEDAWSAGGKMRQVTFRLGFGVEELLQGDDGRTAEDYVWTLIEDLMSALKTDPTITGTVMSVGTVTGRMANGSAPGLWQARFTGSVECRSNFY